MRVKFEADAILSVEDFRNNTWAQQRSSAASDKTLFMLNDLKEDTHNSISHMRSKDWAPVGYERPYELDRIMQVEDFDYQVVI